MEGKEVSDAVVRRKHLEMVVAVLVGNPQASGVHHLPSTALPDWAKSHF